MNRLIRWVGPFLGRLARRGLGALAVMWIIACGSVLVAAPSLLSIVACGIVAAPAVAVGYPLWWAERHRLRERRAARRECGCGGPVNEDRSTKITAARAAYQAVIAAEVESMKMAGHTGEYHRVLGKELQSLKRKGNK